MEKIRNSILAGLAFGILFGIFLAVLFGINYALIAGPISGFAFGITLYFFLASKTVHRQTQIQTAEGESHSFWRCKPFYQWRSSWRKTLSLSDKLQFQSHGFNVQNHGQTINLKQIKEVGFYNTLGLIPNNF